MGTNYKDYAGDPKILHAKTNLDLDGATVKIGYFMPNSTTIAYWDGAVEDRDGDNTNAWIQVNVPADTTVNGNWRLHSYAEFDGMAAGKGIHGDVEKWVIDSLGE